MPRNKRLHFKDLAALKAIAFVPIYLYCILLLITISQQGTLHDLAYFFEKIARSSFDFFFFLSAFLLVSHGLREYKYLNEFSLRNFIIRRLLRIGVVLILCLIFAFAIHPWLIKVLDLHPITHPSIQYYLLGIPNYMVRTTDEELIYLQIICTIYLFLQSYVFIGISLRYFRKQLVSVGLFAIAVGLTSRAFHLWNETDYLMDTLAYGIPIGIGMITAVCVRDENRLFQLIRDLPKQVNPVAYGIGILFFLGGYIFTFGYYSSLFIPVITSFFFAYIIIEQTFGKHSFVQFKSKKILSYLGKLTYGMIVYQAIIGVLIMIAVQSLDFKLNSFYVIGLIILTGYIGSIVIADLSFKLLEKPILRIRREFKKV